MKRTRPTIISAIALAIVGGLLAGCATAGESDAGSTPASDSLLPTAEGMTEYPLAIETWFGESTLEERPERIAVIGSTSAYDAVDTLGAVPVYSYTHPSREAEWWDSDARDLVEVIEYSTEELSVEDVAATNPDLIIALNYWFEDDTLARQLMDIAPVLDYDDRPGNKEDWRKGQRLVGEALDLADAADDAIAATDRAVADAAVDNPQWKGKTATVALDYGSEWGVEVYNVPGGYAEGFLTELGFATNPLGQKFVESPQVSEERMDLLEADYLFMGYFEEGLQQTRESNALFAALTPVREGRYVVMESEDTGVGATWVLRQGASAPGILWLLDVFENEWMASIE